MSAARSAGQNYGGRFRVEHWRFDSRSRHQVARRCNGKNASRSYGVLRACPGGGRGAGRAGGRSGGWSGSDKEKKEEGEAAAPTATGAPKAAAPAAKEKEAKK